MGKREIYNKINDNNSLPSPSKVALEVMRLCYSENSSLQDIANVVETDPALSAEFLKYANSALIASPVPVTSVQRAAVKIGIRGMVNLALSFSLLSQQSTGRCKNFNYNRFWSKSLAQAVAGRAIALLHKSFDPDEIFTSAILSHLGELGFASAFPDEYSEILSSTHGPVALLEAEQLAFGLNHHELSAEMIHDWGLPERISTAVLLHEAYTEKKEDEDEADQLAKLLHLSLQIANICVPDQRLTLTFDVLEERAGAYGVEQDSFGSFFEKIVKTWQEWGYLFKIPTEQCPLYHQIKALDDCSIEEQIRSRSKKTEILILVVDDDPLTLLNLGRILNSETRQIITAENGQAALQLAYDYQPEMIITDWRMPHMDGLQLCQALRKGSTTQHTYIIMLTSNEADDEIVQAFDAGADDYVVKPFTPKVLEARIRGGERLIRQQRTINSDREVIQKYAISLGIANRKLQNMAMTDALTGLPNRRSAMTRMKEVVAESSRFNEQLSCIMIDIDYFKRVNDSYGHDNGDIVLKEIAHVFQENARTYDMVSRIGGEEFLIISTRTAPDGAIVLAERLRTAVENHTIQLSDGSSAKVTISIGIAAWNSGYADDGELIKAADNALYQAKRNGRNRIETAWNAA